jgi:cytochrome c553
MNDKKGMTLMGVFSLGLLMAGNVGAASLVDGTADAGKAKSITCSACHGTDGNSVNPLWPTLAGQHAPYILDQLQAFKNDARSDVLMSAQAKMLSEDDMRNLAVYYESQQRASRTVADASLVDKGEAIYRGGVAETGAAACMSCHGPAGQGNPAASYPSLRGQYATYTAAQLRAYASDARKSDGATRIMRDIAKRLSEYEIVAVASYVQGLR